MLILHTSQAVTFLSSSNLLYSDTFLMHFPFTHIMRLFYPNFLCVFLWLACPSRLAQRICCRLYNYTIIYTLKICYILCYALKRTTGRQRRFSRTLSRRATHMPKQPQQKLKKKTKKLQSLGLMGSRLYSPRFRQTSWQKSMKTNISCISLSELTTISLYSLSTLPATTVSVSASVSLSAQETQLLSQIDICYVKISVTAINLSVRPNGPPRSCVDRRLRLGS